jgi:solute:Na+ symporter, SSS family
MDMLVLAVTVIIYLGVVVYLGFRGYKSTRSTSDYMLAGGKVHPFVMAVSYGATFISTSAIVGFGGAAALFGMGLLWLTFLNISVGIFIAFVVFGKRTRRMGHRLQAHTFPELVGRRFNSRFIQAFCGLIILLFMPLYASAVLIGAARYIETTFALPFEVAAALFSIFIAGYVVAGGLKGVMYTDALQGALMFAGMIILIVYTYVNLGGVVEAHQRLDRLPQEVEAAFQERIPDIAAAMPPGADPADPEAWFMQGAGKLKAANALPDAEKEAAMAADADLPAVGGLMKQYPQLGARVIIAGISKAGFQGWTRMPVAGSNFFYVMVTSIVAGVGIGVLAQPQLVVRFMTVKSTRELNRAVLVGGIFILAMTGVAFVVGNLSNLWFWMPESGGTIAYAKADSNVDLVIPSFINSALPKWFGAVFMLTLLSAAMSTLSSQFHAMGTSIGRDFYEKGILNASEHTSTVLITRIGVILSIIATVILSFVLPSGIVAVATAIFFGLCASAFLPMYVGGLFWKRMTRAGAIASLCTGSGVSLFWLLFVQQPKGTLPALLAQAIFNKPTIWSHATFGIQWNWVEALFVALPISAIVAVVVSLMTQPEPESHIDRCFGE